MEIFAASSSAKLLVMENQAYKAQLPTITHLWCAQQSHTGHNIPAAKEAFFLTRPKSHHGLGCSPVSLLHRKNIRPASSSATVRTLAPSASEAQVEQTIAGEESFQTRDETEFKTVHVRFELRRECAFGLHFFMVGEDPMFGLWDPENAVPLNWSEGHVWSLELDVPCGKVIKYKCILKGGDDYVLWQPGPDRILQTWGTKNTIIVSEDWDTAELQTVVEEDPVSLELSESMEHSQVLKETENLFQLNGDSHETYLEKEITSESDYFIPNNTALDDKRTVSAAENIAAAQNGEKEVEVNGFPISDFKPNTEEAGTSEKLGSSGIKMNLDSGSQAAVRVLVPGLTPVPVAETEEDVSVSEAEEHLHTDSSLNIPEPTLKEEPGIDLTISEETEKWLNGKVGLPEERHPQVQEHRLHDRKEQPNNYVVEQVAVVENDFDWIRRTLQQVMVSLGLNKQNL